MSAVSCDRTNNTDRASGDVIGMASVGHDQFLEFLWVAFLPLKRAKMKMKIILLTQYVTNLCRSACEYSKI